MKTIRTVLLTAVLASALAVVTFGQAALNTTTLSSAITSDDRVATVASSSGITVGDVLVIDREAMRVKTIASTRIGIDRGIEGTTAAAHAAGEMIYSGPSRYFGSNDHAGPCSTLSILALPRISIPSGNRFECTASGFWRLVNPRGTYIANTVWFTLANGAGTTIDDVALNLSQPILITAAKIVYVGATTGTVAAGNARIGVTVGGSEVVAATSYENTKAVGSTTAMTIANGQVAANTPVIVRHTGVAAGPAGSAVVQIEYQYR